MAEKSEVFKTKDVKLRAFSIKNNSISAVSSNLKDLALSKLKSKETVKERCMPLNSDSPSGEKDLISLYKVSPQSKGLFCGMLRLATKENTGQIPDEYLNKKSITISDLLKIKLSESIIYKEHIYLCFNDDYLVTNLPLNRTVSRIQTYLSWLIENELVELTPMVDKGKITQIKDIKSITFQDNKINHSIVSSESTHNLLSGDSQLIKLKNLTKSMLSAIIPNSLDISKIEEHNIISANLLIKFKKPSKMSDDEYSKMFGSILKPVSDLDSISIKRKDGVTQLTGRDMLKMKAVEIDLSNDKLSEEQLLQEMSKFLIELKNEKIDG